MLKDPFLWLIGYLSDGRSLPYDRPQSDQTKPATAAALAASPSGNRRTQLNPFQFLIFAIFFSLQRCAWTEWKTAIWFIKQDFADWNTTINCAAKRASRVRNRLFHSILYISNYFSFRSLFCIIESNFCFIRKNNFIIFMSIELFNPIIWLYIFRVNILCICIVISQVYERALFSFCSHCKIYIGKVCEA